MASWVVVKGIRGIATLTRPARQLCPPLQYPYPAANANSHPLNPRAIMSPHIDPPEPHQSPFYLLAMLVKLPNRQNQRVSQLLWPTPWMEHSLGSPMYSSNP